MIEAELICRLHNDKSNKAIVTGYKLKDSYGNTVDIKCDDLIGLFSSGKIRIRDAVVDNKGLLKVNNKQKTVEVNSDFIREYSELNPIAVNFKVVSDLDKLLTRAKSLGCRVDNSGKVYSILGTDRKLTFVASNKIKINAMDGLFRNFKDLRAVDLSNLDTSAVIDMTDLFFNCGQLVEVNFGDINTSRVTNMSYMFEHCRQLKQIDLSKLNTSSVRSAENMFYECNSLIKVNLDNNDFSRLRSIVQMFYGCESLVEFRWNNSTLKNIQIMSGAFSCCRSLRTVDLNSIEFTEDCDISDIFRRCESLQNVGIKNFNTRDCLTVHEVRSGLYKIYRANILDANVRLKNLICDDLKLYHELMLNNN